MKSLYSKNYSYPVAARIRRDLWKTLIDGIRVKIEPPGVDWKKTIGTTNIGASFGLTVRNILDLKLGNLTLFVTVIFPTTPLIKSRSQMSYVTAFVNRCVGLYKNTVLIQL